MVALGAAHVRFATYPAILAAAMLPYAIGWLQNSMVHCGETVRATARVALLGSAFLGAQADAIARIVLPRAAAAAAETSDCSIRPMAAALAPFAGQVVLSDVDEVPELLYRTGVLTVGSLYHRNAAAFLRLRAAWESHPSATVPEALRAAGVELVLVCTRGGPLSAGHGAPATLHKQLIDGWIPAWLTLVIDDRASGHKLYRVRR